MQHSQQTQLILSFLAGIAGAALLLVLVRESPNLLTRLESSQASTTTATFIPATTQEAAVITATKLAKPAVVSIVVTKDVPVIERYYRQSPLEADPFFRQFFGDNFGPFQAPEYRQHGTQKQEVGGGSGFLVSRDGLIVTNKHVVDDKSAEYTVFTNDGTKHAATIVARDTVNDIALLRIKGGNFSFLQFANSDQIEVGQTAIAIGNALAEFRNTVSVGVVSGLARSITAGSTMGQSEQLENVIQTDAAINPGNSGGPLLNLHGEVIGVNVAVALGSQNIGFAIPANAVRGAVESVEKTGKIVRPFLGVRYMPITPELKEKNKLSVDYGVLVLRGETRDDLAVLPGSPADKAGILENDIILEVEGKKLDQDTSLASIIRAKQVGGTLTLKLLSKSKQKSLTVTLEAAPE
ncbi:MAG: hypothetical protein A2542_01650 [Parcubacteria group bacterium RIFOXYD2_FULL_52_8]|nr:MAG: hypothetical protein A2542_01650 [Parcubacteria group bacterium RIFOXYD2_FULL_52_8]